MGRIVRPDKTSGKHRTEFEKNKKKILATQSVCGICGKPVDKSLKFPHPMSPSIDHIIPVSKNGHPSSLDNLQLTHLCCNRFKSDKTKMIVVKKELIGNRDLPQSCDWSMYGK